MWLPNGPSDTINRRVFSDSASLSRCITFTLFLREVQSYSCVCGSSLPISGHRCRKDNGKPVAWKVLLPLLIPPPPPPLLLSYISEALTISVTGSNCVCHGEHCLRSFVRHSRAPVRCSRRCYLRRRRLLPCCLPSPPPWQGLYYTVPLLILLFLLPRFVP